MNPGPQRGRPLNFGWNISVNRRDFRYWLDKKYSKSWAMNVFYLVKRYHGLLWGGLRVLETFGKTKKNNVLKALVAFSKYLGCYDEFKARVSSYGIKWESLDSMEAFPRNYAVEGRFDGLG